MGATSNMVTPSIELRIALLPKVMVLDELTRGKLEPVLADWTAPSQALYAVYPRHHQVSQRVRLFVEFLASHLRVTDEPAAR
jgi:DNA-binding transcriptional LysR family regulator